MDMPTFECPHCTMTLDLDWLNKVNNITSMVGMMNGLKELGEDDLAAEIEQMFKSAEGENPDVDELAFRLNSVLAGIMAAMPEGPFVPVLKLEETP
jgi:hypothetical protein